MKSFRAEIAIAASPETVWRILTDAPGWTTWNTTVDKIEGRIELGARVKVYPKISPGRAFPVLVTEFTPPHKMVWTGGMSLGFLFKGVRIYTLTPQGGSVRFVMEEAFSGLLSPMIEKSIPDMQPAFQEFAEALKKRSESERRSV
jgi:hypothetical protein